MILAAYCLDKLGMQIYNSCDFSCKLINKRQKEYDNILLSELILFDSII